MCSIDTRSERLQLETVDKMDVRDLNAHEASNIMHIV